MNSRKKSTRVFRLNKIRVCKSVFLNTLGITNGRLNYCINHKANIETKMCSPDKRGNSITNRTSLSAISRIHDFLMKFPKFTSHYSQSERVYFSPELNLSKLYNLYIEDAKINNYTHVSRPIFYTNFREYNVGFYIPKTDTCNTCDTLKIQIDAAVHDEKTELTSQLNSHHDRAENVRSNFTKAIQLSKEDPSILVFSFDMQQTTPLPKINTSIVFYKRQLWLYNLGIHTCHNDNGYMMVWTENEGKRGATEVCSSIHKFLSLIELKNYKKIKTFSDSCGGQNRNKAIICFFMFICNMYGIESWEHSYLESGHSYLPNDRDFGTISKSARYVSAVYSVDQWIDVIENARKKNPFKVVRMGDSFLNIDKLIRSRKFNNSLTNSSSKFNFLKLKWFRVTQNSNMVEYVTSESSNVFALNYPPVSDLEAESLETENRSQKISRNKYDDLMSLMHLIPDVYKPFYTDLSHE